MAKAIFPRTTPGLTGGGGNRFLRTSVGSNRKAASVGPQIVHTHHTASMLAQASRVPRLANIGSVQSLLRTGATRTGGAAGARGGKR